MISPVNLYDKPTLKAYEIYDEIADNMLSPEFYLIWIMA